MKDDEFRPSSGPVCPVRRQAGDRQVRMTKLCVAATCQPYNLPTCNLSAVSCQLLPTVTALKQHYQCRHYCVLHLRRHLLQWPQ
jgi:hypothetical protein